MTKEMRGQLPLPDGASIRDRGFSRYNESITRRLLTGALDTLSEAGVPEHHIEVAWVPGAWEIPLVAAMLAVSQQYSAVLCLGAVKSAAKQRTINTSTSRSPRASHASRSKAVFPVQFGVLTCNTMEQAIHRAGGNAGNKGVEWHQPRSEWPASCRLLSGPRGVDCGCGTAFHRNAANPSHTCPDFLSNNDAG